MVYISKWVLGTSEGLIFPDKEIAREYLDMHLSEERKKELLEISKGWGNTHPTLYDHITENPL